MAEVRELYGTMQEKQSAKGVLVTSSAFTAGALKFAEGKSIELIDGMRLSELVVGTPQPKPDVSLVEQPIPEVFLAAEYDFSGPAPEEQQEGDAMVTPPKGWLGEELNPTQIAFFVAANEADLERLMEAIQNGANVNARLSSGVTALQLAMSNNQIEVALVLIASGVDVNHALYAEDGSGLTPLQYAVGLSQREVAFQLLMKGADPNGQNGDGLSPLSMSIFRLTQPDAGSVDIEIIKDLTQFGADTQQAYRMATELRFPEAILQLLRPP